MNTMGLSRSGYGMHHVMLLTALEGRTGELIVESGNNIGTLLFHQGRILLALSPYTRAIGDLLVEKGVLSEAELLAILKQQRSGPHMPVGALLLKAGKVTFPSIEAMVHDQIREAMRHFASWSPLGFHFVDKEVKPFDSISLPVTEFLPEDMKKSAQMFVSSLSATAGQSPVKQP